MGIEFCWKGIDNYIYTNILYLVKLLYRQISNHFKYYITEIRNSNDHWLINKLVNYLALWKLVKLESELRRLAR